ncbi:hypothetical protein PLICRDRAFT_180207 [Plicaturopsis crispa FD-325 SS-3]|uniref:Uncharacterized protein n=1 Tax=Plicaturopsis crispa FD-325 SS-3 TaxID=944288 RepID=A0A0C9SWB0_PLICR|nr:hypothetical protein PLICRDRAFT_180207 [Plicaturopsis crispa FD-325 SS-3]
MPTIIFHSSYRCAPHPARPPFGTQKQPPPSLAQPRTLSHRAQVPSARSCGTHFDVHAPACRAPSPCPRHRHWCGLEPGLATSPIARRPPFPAVHRLSVCAAAARTQLCTVHRCAAPSTVAHRPPLRRTVHRRTAPSTVAPPRPPSRTVPCRSPCTGAHSCGTHCPGSPAVPHCAPSVSVRSYGTHAAVRAPSPSRTIPGQAPPPVAHRPPSRTVPGRAPSIAAKCAPPAPAWLGACSHIVPAPSSSPFIVLSPPIPAVIAGHANGGARREKRRTTSPDDDDDLPTPAITPAPASSLRPSLRPLPHPPLRFTPTPTNAFHPHAHILAHAAHLFVAHAHAHVNIRVGARAHLCDRRHAHPRDCTRRTLVPRRPETRGSAPTLGCRIDRKPNSMRMGGGSGNAKGVGTESARTGPRMAAHNGAIRLVVRQHLFAPANRLSIGAARSGRRRQRTTGRYALSFGLVYAFVVATQRHATAARCRKQGSSERRAPCPPFDAFHILPARAMRPPRPRSCRAHPTPSLSVRVLAPSTRARPPHRRSCRAHIRYLRACAHPPHTPPHPRAHAHAAYAHVRGLRARGQLPHTHTRRARARPLRPPHAPCTPTPPMRTLAPRARPRSPYAHAHVRPRAPHALHARTYVSRTAFFIFLACIQ